ncbi:L,D-transpeptidase family protein [Anaerosalibacter sp. Marseille-P3206]|uniref:L,D-transpeptidase family protein n=1 Tax=Anaerosalibacter sp. Marseille-P3206 TaxID=1871005 RepID=UPI0009873ECE|nr:L,D-transpeptidase family protein [Anaerosalibacter sp. Marseille-P3206]
MKKDKNILLIILVVFIFSIGLMNYYSKKVVQANYIEKTESKERIPLVSRSLNLLEERSDKVSNHIYEGEALNTIEKNGNTIIYIDKDEQSDVIVTLKDYEKIELLETIPNGWFKVKLKSGQVGYVDARYIRTDRIPPHKYDENSSEWVIKFSENNQTIRIFNKGELVLKSIGSSGIRDSFTPKGVFQIEEGRRGEWSYVPRFEQGMKYWVGFKGTYLFHSIPCTIDGEIIEEEAKKLGKPSSHGCIRLPVEVSKFIFDNVPDGSIVIIE